MPRRGDLVKDGQPLDSEDIAIATGMPKSLFEEMVANCSSDKIKWIELVVCEKYAPLPLHSEDAPREDREQPENAPATGQDSTGHNKRGEEEEGSPSTAGAVPSLAELEDAGVILRTIKGLDPKWAKLRDNPITSAINACGDKPARAKAVKAFLDEMLCLEEIPADFPLGRFKGFMRRATDYDAKAPGTSPVKPYPTLR